ncbi:MAG TPA: outer membrane lipoprotein carrier protein LolA [Gemmatimonadaceae bacterium]|nr:outer membrane lipoprotein carrier protein LolA [Gemmatimonadaceae bacterium]
MLLISLAVVSLACPPTRSPAPIAAAPAPQVGTQETVEATIKRAIAAWSKVKTLRATFEQTLTNPITGSAMVSTGTLEQRKPNQLAITFQDPAGDRIVGDGTFVWVYLQSATPGQVIKLSNTDAGAASTDLIGQFLNTPRSKYDATDAGTEKVASRNARAVVLLAKPGQALPFVRAKVWVDAADGLIRQFEATDPNGITRKVRLLTMQPNASVSAKAFVFMVPDGVRVVER